MQESRLFKIVYYLLEQGHATAPELAEKLEVSVRTIYRDIEALSEAGIPLYTEPGRNGGIYLMNEFVLDRALLSREEQKELLVALQSLNAACFINSGDILDKLSGLFHMDATDWLEVDFSRWGDASDDNRKFELLKSAVIHHKCVSITYAGTNGTIRERTIQPLKLMYKSMAWYLKAYCMERQDYRLFKLTRILNLTVLNEGFPPRSFPEQTDASQQTYPTITLRFSKEMAYRVYDEFDSTQIVKQSNGDFMVTAQMPVDGWLMGFLLSFGTQVEIVEPAYLRETLAEQARLIYKKNKY